MKLLIIEDQEKTANSLNKGFRQEGFEVDLAFDGEIGQKLARTHNYDCIILDITLPKISGLNILRTIRSRGIGTPVIILTARGSVEDKVFGLELGADDYLAKPFSFEELLARVKALVRRFSDHPVSQQNKDDASDAFVLNSDKLAISKGGKIAYLSRIEFKILEILFSHKGAILSESKIIEHVWGCSHDVNSNVVAAHIKNIRKKLRNTFGEGELLIKTVKGLGYRFCYE